MAVQKKAKTMQLPKGGEYAKVPERLRIFREENPNGLVETNYVINDGMVIFTTRVLRDKARPESAEAVGHAMNKLDNNPKVFEKTETQSLGRALALLGYLASGEIASAEEMADFYAYREEKINEIVGHINSTESIDELKKYFLSLGAMMAEKKIVDAKNAMKERLARENEKDTTA